MADHERDIARREYDLALKMLRQVQMQFAEALVDAGKLYSRYPASPSHVAHLGRSIRQYEKAVESAASIFEKASLNAKKHKVTHGGDKFGGAMKNGERV